MDLSHEEGDEGRPQVLSCVQVTFLLLDWAYLSKTRTLIAVHDSSGMIFIFGWESCFCLIVASDCTLGLSSGLCCVITFCDLPIAVLLVLSNTPITSSEQWVLAIC